MKRIKAISALLMLFTAIGFTSCETEPVDPVLTNNNNNNNGLPVFQVDFSGETYTATATTAVVQDGAITIKGIRGTSGEMVSLVIPGTATGTYNMALMSYIPTAASEFYYTNLNDAQPTGQVTITSVDTTNNTISGTFSFTGYYTNTEAELPSLSFTNGSFQNIPYRGTIVTNPGTALFEAEIDGEEYVATSTIAAIGEGLISVAGYRGTNGENIAIVVNATSEGIYSEEAIMVYYTDINDESGYNNLFGTPGTVTISDIDTANHTISGTFSFTGTNDAGDAKVITNGVFENIPYTSENVSGDELTATVDGSFIDYQNSIYVTYTGHIGFGGLGADHGIRLSISDELGVGTHEITDELFGDVAAYYTDDADNEYQAPEGTVTITSKSGGRIEGIFNYVIKNDAGEVIHEITDGEFNVEYDF